MDENIKLKLHNKYGVLDANSASHKLSNEIHHIMINHIEGLIRDGVEVVEIKALEGDFISSVLGAFAFTMLKHSFEKRKKDKGMLNASNTNFDI